jgi:hypothetical protein
MRITVTATYQKRDVWTDHVVRREFPTARLYQPEVKNMRMCDHVWLHHAGPLMDLDPKPGDRVTFTALVKPYLRNTSETSAGGEVGDRVESFFLDHPQDIKMAAALCVPIPKEVPAQKPIAYLNGNGYNLFPNPPHGVSHDPPPIANVVKPSEPESPIALITAVKELAKRCGGLSKLKELVAILES